MQERMRSDSDPDDRFVTIKELAEYLKVLVKTLYRWRHVGYGPPAHVIGGQLRYRRSEVESWLDESRDP